MTNYIEKNYFFPHAHVNGLQFLVQHWASAAKNILKEEKINISPKELVHLLIKNIDPFS
jgi:hypothetical protein